MTADSLSTDARVKAYRALRVAAARIGANNYRAGLYRPRYKQGKLVHGYSITAAHAALIDAMPRVLSGAMTPDQAMALLHEWDVMQQRFGAPSAEEP